MDDWITVLEKGVGTWEGEVETLQPNSATQKSRGTMEGRLVGGRWLVLDFKNENGFEGHGIYGYDPAAKAYAGIWVDSMRDFLAIGRGTWDDRAQKMTYRYEHPIQGRPTKWREEATFNADGTQGFQVIAPVPDGKDAVMMGVIYRRVR